MSKKVLVLHVSGKIGKSVMARELFYQHMDNALYIEVEERNSGTEGFKGINSIRISAEKFMVASVFTKKALAENLVVDVGASQLAEFFEMAQQIEGLIEDFDFFIIPCNSDVDVIKDTVTTIYILMKDYNIPKEKIKIIFNRVKADPRENSSLMEELIKKVNIPYKVSFDLCYPSFSAMNALIESQKTTREICEDTTDYFTLCKETPKDDPKFPEYSAMLVQKATVTRMFQASKDIFERIVK